MNRGSRQRRRVRRDDQAARALPDFVDVVSIAIRAGHSPHQALIAATGHAEGALQPVAQRLAWRVQRGERLQDALVEFGHELGTAGMLFADTLGTAVRYGAPLGPVLDQLGADARSARQRDTDRYVRTLPVRLAFPLVTCTLPGFVLCAIAPALLGALSTLSDAVP